MDLKQINEEYVNFKKDLEMAKIEVDNIEKRVGDLLGDKKIVEAALVQAQRANDDKAQEKYSKNIELLDEEIRKVQEEAEEKRANIQEIQNQIDARIEQVKNDPQMKQHLEEIMAKKSQRKINRLQEEKDEVLDKRDRLENLNILINNHPALENNLKGMLAATKDIERLQKELDEMVIPDPTRQDQIENQLIPAAQEKIAKTKGLLLDYIAKNNLDIKEEDIDNLKIAESAEGVIDIKGSMNKSMSALNRQIKGYNKQIANHTNIILNNQPTRPDPQILTEEPEMEEEPKWYNFIQRFRNWRERRRQRALPEPEEEYELEPEEGQEITDRDKFKTSLKFDITRDILAKEEQEAMQKAKEQRKEEMDR